MALQIPSACTLNLSATEATEFHLSYLPRVSFLPSEPKTFIPNHALHQNSNFANQEVHWPHWACSSCLCSYAYVNLYHLTYNKPCVWQAACPHKP